MPSTRTVSPPAAEQVAAAGIAAPRWLAILLITTGAAGLLAAFTLSIEKVHRLEQPELALGCDLNPFVSCSGAMDSWQAQVLGFPNSFVGILCFTAVIVVGVATLAGARFSRWFWTLFTVGVVCGLGFALWLAGQSVFDLGLVCPWCFLVYMTMSAMTFPLLGWGFGAGALPAPAGLRSWAATWGEWSWVLSLALAVAIVLTIVIAMPQIPRFLFG